MANLLSGMERCRLLYVVADYTHEDEKDALELHTIRGVNMTLIHSKHEKTADKYILVIF